MLRNVLQRLRDRARQGGLREDQTGDLLPNFSLEVTSSRLEQLGLEATSHGDLFGASVTAEAAEWSPIQEVSGIDLAEAEFSTQCSNLIASTAPRLPGAPQPKTTDIPAGRDRRTHPRHESGCIVAVLPSCDKNRVSRDRVEWLLRSTDLRGQLVDVSMTGLAMELCQPLERDSRIELRISNPRFDHHVDCAARVLRCRHSDNGNWQIVCRFERSLTFQQIHRIGRHLFASTIV